MSATASASDGPSSESSDSSYPKSCYMVAGGRYVEGSVNDHAGMKDFMARDKNMHILAFGARPCSSLSLAG